MKSPRSFARPAAALAAAALAAPAGAQTISFDNSCGNSVWHHSCGFFDPPSNTCYIENNWDTGTATSPDCHTFPHEPGPADDVFIGNFNIEANPQSAIRSLVAHGQITDTYIIDVATTADYYGAVTGDGAFGGAGTHTFHALLTPSVSGQFMSFRWPAAIVLTGGLTIPDGAGIDQTAEVWSASTTTWASTSIFYIDGAYGGGTNCVFHNMSGALFLATRDAEMRGIIGLGHYENAGTFRKDGGLGNTVIGSEFKNTATGVLDVRTGNLSLNEVATLRGAAQVSSGAQIEIRSAATVPDLFTVTGPGKFRVSSVLSVDAGATANVANIDMGLLNGEAPYRRGAGALNITNSAILGGTSQEGGVTTLMPATQSSVGYHVALDTDCRLDNRGVITWKFYDFQIAAGASFNILPGGTLDCRGDNNVGSLAFTEGVMTNAGTLRKSAGDFSQVRCVFTNTGTISVESGRMGFSKFHQTAGQTILAGGVLDGDYQVEPLRFEGGTLRGNGNIKGWVENSGATVAPGNSAGLISIGGGIYGNSYTQGPDGTLSMEIGGAAPGSGYDQLAVDGSATLDGTLRVTIINGYTPTTGQTFDILTCTSRSGKFSTIIAPGFSVQCLPTGVRLTATCYANCDGSTTSPILNVNDFACFLNKFAAGDPAANCDGSTSIPVLNVNDFACFLNRFASGCP